MAAEVHLGKRMSHYAITNEAFDPTDAENATPNSHEYQNAKSLKQIKGLNNQPVLSTFQAEGRNNGRINRGYDSSDDLERDQRLYENPSVRNQGILQHKTSTPRKKANAIYEPMNGGTPNVTPKHEQRQKNVPTVEQAKPKISEGSSRDSKCGRIILPCILLIAVITLILVLLIMIGKIGPNAKCPCSSDEGSSLRLVGSTSSDTALILIEIKALRNNVSRAHQKVELRKRQAAELQTDIQKQKDEHKLLNNSLNIRDNELRINLENANKSWVEFKSDITSQSEKLVLELQEAYNIIARDIESVNVTWKQINNSMADKANRMIAKVLTATQDLSYINKTHRTKDAAMQKTIEELIANSNAVNLTRHEEFKTLFDRVIADLTKINSTLHLMDEEIASVVTVVDARVAAANTTLLNNIESAKQILESEDAKLSNSLTTVNSTITEKAEVKESEIGETGPQGANGTIGQKGPQGSPGASGPGNLSTCTRHSKTNNPPKLTISTDVPGVKVVMSVSCTGLDKKIIARLDVTNPPAPTEYKCSCYEPGLSSDAVCVMHYWLCDK